MAIYIPEEKLLEIRSAANISDIISERVVLKKTGKDLVGLCPFHSEKTPSFSVSPVKQIFHCFGCGAGGDVFSFLMKHDGIGFSDAVSSLARRYGIDLPTGDMTPGQKKNISERQQLFDLNKQVLSFFVSRLASRVEGEKARAYLKKRGFSQEIIKAFGLGFAPDEWDSLVRFFQKINVPQSIAEKTGLIVPRKNQGFYDRFRNRIMFPIFDVTHQVIGFGGRVLDDSKPKYLNSPETIIYNKSKSLFGAQAARNKARETGCVYIVEGYFDLLAMHQHGITNTVATLGTALTAEHVRLLRRGFAQKAFLLFDSDEAGLKAAQRSVSLFMNEAMDAVVIVLPKGYDPDSYMFEFGRPAFETLSEKAAGMVEFLIESAISVNGLSMEGKVRIISELTGPLSEINDHVARSIYIQYLSERIGVDESAISEKIQAEGKRAAYHQPVAQSGHPCETEPQTDGENAISPEMNRLEKHIMTMMLKFPGILPEIKKRRVLEFFSDKQLIAIGALLLEHPVVTQEDLSGLMNRLASPDDQRIIASLAICDDCWDYETGDKLLCQFLNSRQRRQGSLLNQIKAAEKNNDDTLLFELLRKKQAQRANR
ncbi:MAG: DNA primase [Desulfobacteraceae bacterium]|nr:MAG: DNA primase [Desulfobacteraceae bacterium]